MNILHVRPYFEPGGVSKYTFKLSEGLSSCGHQVIFACNDCFISQRFNDNLRIYKNISLSPANFSNLIRTITQLKRIISSENVHIINTHHRFASLAAKLVCFRTGIPLVSTVHEIKQDHHWMTRFGIGQHVISISDAIKQNLISSYKVPAEKISVIKIGLDNQCRHEGISVEQIKKSLAINTPGPFIGCIGRFSLEKGQIYLLQAIPKIIKEFQGACFLFMGDGPDRDALEKITEDLDITNNVFFLGWRDDVGKVADLLDLVVIPSLSEGLSLVALEMLEKKKAVIATNVGGIPEVVQNMHTGILIPPGNSLAIQEAVIMLLKNPGLRQSLGDKGSRFVNDNFSFEKMIDQTEKIYKALIH